jgi:hypothetical protein
MHTRIRRHIRTYTLAFAYTHTHRETIAYTHAHLPAVLHAHAHAHAFVHISRTHAFVELLFVLVHLSLEHLLYSLFMAALSFLQEETLDPERQTIGDTKEGFYIGAEKGWGTSVCPPLRNNCYLLATFLRPRKGGRSG